MLSVEFRDYLEMQRVVRLLIGELAGQLSNAASKLLQNSGRFVALQPIMAVTLISTFTAPELRAQPLRRGSIVLNVSSEQVIRSETQWQTSWGSFSRDFLNSRILIVDIKKIGAGDATVRLEYYFIGKDHDSRSLFVYSSGAVAGYVKAGGVKVIPRSTVLLSNRTNVSGSNRLSGRVPWGWGVFVTQNGRLLAEQANLPEVLDWLRANRPEVRSSDQPGYRPKFIPNFP